MKNDCDEYIYGFHFNLSSSPSNNNITLFFMSVTLVSCISKHIGRQNMCSLEYFGFLKFVIFLFTHLICHYFVCNVKLYILVIFVQKLTEIYLVPFIKYVQSLCIMNIVLILYSTRYRSIIFLWCQQRRAPLRGHFFNEVPYFE